MKNMQKLKKIEYNFMTKKNHKMKFKQKSLNDCKHYKKKILMH